MSGGFLTLADLGVAVLAVLALASLSGRSPARAAVRLGTAGMALACVVALAHPSGGRWGVALLALIAGGLVGRGLATRVRLARLPQLVTGLHALAGLGAVLVGLATFLHPSGLAPAQPLLRTVEVYLAVVGGAMTGTAAGVVWLTGAGVVSARPLRVVGRHRLTAVLVAALVVLAVPTAAFGTGFFWLCLAALVAATLGAHLVLAVGSVDGAVSALVLACLGSGTGWTLAALGFLLALDLLLVVGGLVGTAAAVVGMRQAAAMGRPVIDVLFGDPVDEPRRGESTPDPVDVDGLVRWLRAAKDVAIVVGDGADAPGALPAVRALVDALSRRGTSVRCVVPAAARGLVGLQHLVLAEAGVPVDRAPRPDDGGTGRVAADVVLWLGTPTDAGAPTVVAGHVAWLDDVTAHLPAVVDPLRS